MDEPQQNKQQAPKKQVKQKVKRLIFTTEDIANKFTTGKVVILQGSHAENTESSNAYSFLIKKSKESNGLICDDWKNSKSTFVPIKNYTPNSKSDKLKAWKLSDTLISYQINSIEDLTQAIRKANATLQGIDIIIIDGHGLDNYLILNGASQLRGREREFGDNPNLRLSLCSESMFNLELTPENIKGIANRKLKPELSYAGTGLMHAAEEVKKSRNTNADPLLFLSGCNVSYEEEGKVFINLLSKYIFKNFLVISPCDYTVVKYDKSGKNLYWETTKQLFTPLSLFVIKDGVACNFSNKSDIVIQVNFQNNLYPIVMNKKKQDAPNTNTASELAKKKLFAEIVLLEKMLDKIGIDSVTQNNIQMELEKCKNVRILQQAHWNLNDVKDIIKPYLVANLNILQEFVNSGNLQFDEFRSRSLVQQLIDQANAAIKTNELATAYFHLDIVKKHINSLQNKSNFQNLGKVCNTDKDVILPKPKDDDDQPDEIKQLKNLDSVQQTFSSQYASNANSTEKQYTTSSDPIVDSDIPTTIMKLQELLVNLNTNTQQAANDLINEAISAYKQQNFSHANLKLEAVHQYIAMHNQHPILESKDDVGLAEEKMQQTLHSSSSLAFKHPKCVSGDHTTKEGFIGKVHQEENEEKLLNKLINQHPHTKNAPHSILELKEQKEHTNDTQLQDQQNDNTSSSEKPADKRYPPKPS